ncbi:hypothetical protein ACFQT0_29180 [Hymenobacter humi]|uniref:Uncharacterized protein n=1 Tax=Hymenobacter humi TaxID=1411620 RepID=A0ABW2UDX1_9BACT
MTKHECSALVKPYAEWLKSRSALHLLLLLGFALFHTSCVNTRVIDAVRIRKGQTLYQNVQGASNSTSVNAVVLPKSTLAQLSLVEAGVAIKVLPPAVGADSAALRFFFPMRISLPARGMPGITLAKSCGSMSPTPFFRPLLFR